jgi:hypothetical protein
MTVIGPSSRVDPTDRRRVPVLVRADEVVLESPCDEDWDRMRPEPGGRRRWCDHCERQVHDLSRMGEQAARALLREHAGRRVCITYIEDEDGEVVFAPEPNIVPLQRLARRPLAEAVKVAGAASVVAVLAACTPHGDAGEAIRIDDAEATQVTPTTVIPAASPSSPSTPTARSDEPEAEQPCKPPIDNSRLLPCQRIRRSGGRGGDDDSNPLGGL